MGSLRGSRPSSPGKLPAMNRPVGTWIRSSALAPVALRFLACAPESTSPSNVDNAVALATSAGRTAEAPIIGEASDGDVDVSRRQPTAMIASQPRVTLRTTLLITNFPTTVNQEIQP